MNLSSSIERFESLKGILTGFNVDLKFGQDLFIILKKLIGNKRIIGDKMYFDWLGIKDSHNGRYTRMAVEIKKSVY